MSLGKRVEQLRKARGWTQAELCAMVPGLKQQALDRLEKRDSRKSDFAPGLAAAFDVPLLDLLGAKGTLEATQHPGTMQARGLVPPPRPPSNYADRRTVTESEWALLNDIKTAMESPRLAAQVEELRREARAMEAFAAKHYRPK